MTEAERVELRPVTDHDGPFLFEVFASTRRDELTLTGWDEATCDAFLRQQHSIRDAAYRAQFPGSELSVIEIGGTPVGRLHVAREIRAVYLVDIALLPTYRNRGIGRHVIEALQLEAIDTARPLVLHVDKTNRARRLYERLGFTVSGDEGLYWTMTWRSATSERPIERELQG